MPPWLESQSQCEKSGLGQRTGNGAGSSRLKRPTPVSWQVGTLKGQRRARGPQKEELRQGGARELLASEAIHEAYLGV